LINNKKVLGLIPARAGSKGVPGKNIRKLAGKPLIEHTIKAAKESKIVDYIAVSTDGKQIGYEAERAGAYVPFIRPAELATDNAKGIDVIHYALAWFEKRGLKHDLVMVLQPTSPLRSPIDLREACDLMIRTKAQAVVSVCEVDHHPWWSNTLPKDRNMGGFLRPEIVGANRQELPAFYRLNGAIYLADWDFIKNRDSWYGPLTYAYVMPQERSIDIDTEFDWRLAEMILTERNSRI